MCPVQTIKDEENAIGYEKKQKRKKKTKNEMKMTLFLLYKTKGKKFATHNNLRNVLENGILTYIVNVRCTDVHFNISGEL